MTLGAVGLVFVYAMITAVATGLGALPFALVRSVSPRGVAYANAVASGLMLGASFGIALEGMERGAAQTLTGGFLGLVFVVLAERFLERRGGGLEGARAAATRRMVLIVAVMTAHSFAEGVAVGVSFGAGAALAVPITVAIAVHNVPEGLAISAVLRPQGLSVLACAWWSIVSSLPQPLMVVPAFLFVETFASALPYGLGFAAGAMVFMVLVELLPEAYEDGRRGAVAGIVTSTLVAMVLFQHYL